MSAWLVKAVHLARTMPGALALLLPARAKRSVRSRPCPAFEVLLDDLLLHHLCAPFDVEYLAPQVGNPGFTESFGRIVSQTLDASLAVANEEEVPLTDVIVVEMVVQCVLLLAHSELSVGQWGSSIRTGFKVTVEGQRFRGSATHACLCLVELEIARTTLSQ